MALFQRIFRRFSDLTIRIEIIRLLHLEKRSITNAMLEEGVVRLS
jgi:hypothetical protein